MSKFKVNVIVAGRPYSLSVMSEQDEQGLRKAAKNINELISKFEQRYAIGDKQDVLAMCALQYASKLAIDSLKENEDEIKIEKKINELTNLLDDHLKK